jgi:formate dehydrogenase subunit gamma
LGVRSAAARRNNPDTILRFHRSERWVHWSIAVPFMICYATAVVLFAVYYANPGRPYRELFSWAHRLSGLCLFALPTLVLVRSRQEFRVHLANVRQAWIWTLSDVKWLGLMGLAAVSNRFELPEQGKFNAAEKLNFMMVMTTWPLYIVTGILIWMPGVAFLAWVMHVATTPLMLGHIFMATINPDTRVGLSGMISGFVDRQWAKHHYRRWYRERFEDSDRFAPRPRPVPKTRPRTVALHCPGCHRELVVASWERLLEVVFSVEPVACSHCQGRLDVLAVAGEPDDVEWILGKLDAATRRAIERGGEPAVFLSLAAVAGAPPPRDLPSSPP